MPKPTDMELQQIVELEGLAAEVSNGEAHNVQLHGKVLGKLTSVFCLVLRKGIMTVDECKARDGNLCDGDSSFAPKVKVGPVSLSGFKFRDLERWAIIGLIVWLLLAQHGVTPNPRIRQMAQEAAKAVVMTPVDGGAK